MVSVSKVLGPAGVDRTGYMLTRVALCICSQLQLVVDGLEHLCNMSAIYRRTFVFTGVRYIIHDALTA